MNYMAIIKVINGNYSDPYVHERLVQYAMMQKVYNRQGNPTGDYVLADAYGGYNLFFGNVIEQIPVLVGQQMMTALESTGKNQGQFLKHIVLSFDSKGTENWITLRDAVAIAQNITTSFFPQFQVFWGVHANRKSHLHIHFIINSVNIFTHCKFPDKKDTYMKLKTFVKRCLPTENCTITYE